MKMMKLLFLKYKREKSSLPILALLLFVSLVPMLALLHPGLPPTHDGEYHIVRAHQFDKTLHDGSWYPRWQPDVNFGYGLPLLNYYYPLPYYAISLFHSVGLSFIDGFKLGMVIAVVAGGIFFYLWSSTFWGRTGGVVSAIFYTFSPYHIVQVYIRGSAGELWSLAFFPACLWAITKLIRERRGIFAPFASVFLALLVFSHNVLAYLFMPFALSYAIVLILQYRSIRKTAFQTTVAFLLGIGLSAIFWLPALLERNFVTGLQIHNIEEHFPELYQLLFPSWGSGFSALDLQNQMSFQIGVANLLAIITTLILVLFFSSQRKGALIMLWFFLSWFFLLFFFMLKVSLSLWKTIPLLFYSQFPWRLLALEVLIASFLAGSLLARWKSLYFAIPFSLFAILLSIQYTKPAYYLMRGDAYYMTRANFIDGTNTPGDIFNTIWMNRSLRRQKEKFKIVSGLGEVRVRSIKATSYKVEVLAKQDLVLSVHTAYFPGWQAFVDGEKTSVEVNSDGLIQFRVPKGVHAVAVKFLNTPVRNIATAISFSSLFFLVALLAKLVRARMERLHEDCDRHLTS